MRRVDWCRTGRAVSRDHVYCLRRAVEEQVLQLDRAMLAICEKRAYADP